ncbi:MAG: sugar-binding transcriptional regulator, partial [Thermoguttaceae bacterium]
LGLRHAVVVKTAKGLSSLELRQSLTHFAAPCVARWIPAPGSLAIAGGRTMQWLVHNLAPPPGVEGLAVVQSMGNIDASVGPYDALELGRVLANRWCGKFFVLNTPALLPDARTRKTLLGLESVRSVVEQLRKVDAALVGVGSLHNSVFVERGVLGGKDTAQLAKAGAVGEICGRFYDRDGKECQTPYRDRVISIELADLQRVEQSIAVVAGSDRTEAILGAVRGGLMKYLAIDRAGAAALLEAGWP